MPAAAAPSPVAALLEKQRYDPAILPQLEAFVDKADAYDLEAHLACLKLYQFHPDQLKEATVAKVLVKALTRLPQTDYLACTYLVPERILDKEQISHIVAAAALLESCRFRDFWGALAPLRSGVLSGMPAFDAAVRTFVLRTFEITYQSVPTAHLRASLGLDSDSAVLALVKERGWTAAGDLIKIAANGDNTATTKRVDAGNSTSLDQMSKILASVNAAAKA